MINAYRSAGFTILSITDHDTLEGYREASKIQAQESMELQLVPGVELSTQWGGTNIHVLGLGVDPDHPGTDGAEYLRPRVVGRPWRALPALAADWRDDLERRRCRSGRALRIVWGKG